MTQQLCEKHQCELVALSPMDRFYGLAAECPQCLKEAGPQEIPAFHGLEVLPLILGRRIERLPSNSEVFIWKRKPLKKEEASS